MLSTAPTFSEGGTIGSRLVCFWLNSIQSEEANAELLEQASLYGGSALHRAMWRGATALRTVAADNVAYLRQCGGLLFLGHALVQELPGGKYAVRARPAA